jgi:predicted porin
MFNLGETCMKKSLIALAVLAAAGTASAQSSVTLFGVVDAALEHISNSGAASGTRMTQGGNTRSNFGLRGTEDLGGGMAASFWLESSVSVDDGTGSATNQNNQSTGATGGATGLVFDARSTVSLSGGWGELRLGRDYTPAFRSISAFDPFGTRGVGTNQILNSNGGSVAMLTNGTTNVRASNSIGYFLPTMGGVYGELKYWLGENQSTATNAAGADISKDGRGGGLRVGYASGPFNIAGAWDRTKYATGNYTEANIGGSWDFGMAKVMAIVERDKSGSTTGKGWEIGTIVPVGAGDIKASYGRYRTDVTAADPTAKKIALGYVHNLSKRTALYVTYARVKNSGGSTAPVQNGAFGSPAANQSSTGYDLGLKHSF